MEELLAKTYFNNTVKDYLIAAGIIVGGLIVLAVIKRFVLKRLYSWAERTETSLDDIIVRTIERFGLPLMSFMVIYWGLNYLEFTERGSRVLEIATGIVITFFIVRLISASIQVILQKHISKQEGGTEKLKQLSGIMIILNIIIWTLGALALFDNLGYNVTTIVAGLGIGGIAIALAAQNILGDLFNYFVIFFDRPFEIGDYIVVDDKKGTVEYIGIKTTRLKALSGEQLILSNSDLTKSRLHNFKRLQSRRILFSFGVVYEATSQQLKEIPEIIKSIIQELPNTTFDRAHFFSYGSFSLNFEVVYHVNDPEYNVYMDVQQQINLRMYDEFAKRGIEFAYPTQRVISRETALEVQQNQPPKNSYGDTQ
jgi:small-conductance mechanosensitive channel